MNKATAHGLRVIFVAAAAALVACSGEDDEAFTDCAIGELTGTWRTRYTETDGTCGPISDETTVFDPNSEPSPGCTVTANNISADKCRAEFAFTCPTTDNQGTQSWTQVIDQTGSGTLEGTATVQLNHPSIVGCRSTYDLTISRL